MLKISFHPGSVQAPPVLTLEGRIAGRWVDELRRVYAGHYRPSRPLTLDLRGVTFIDQAGVRFLDEIYRHVSLVNCSLFAAEQLRLVLERHDAERP